MKIWIDADSCPVKVREVVLKAAERTKTALILVANKKIPHKNSEIVKNIIVENDLDAADNYIFNNTEKNDIVITRDIPLAEKLVSKNINVINDRGTQYTPENIKERLSIRNIMYAIRESGLETDRETNYNQKDLQKFANLFDSLLTKMIKLCNNK
ncbi:MAG: YaiI/YqxD family protein [Spirochaetes bacterium]|nr:YaiI/YqxD family protein [Spirochaetota bacterium]